MELVAGLIIENKRILLVHNTKYGSARMEPPGGKRHPDESLEGCLRREVREEVGLEVISQRLLGVYRTGSPEGEFQVYMYLCEVVAGEPVVREPDKIDGFGWYSYRELEDMRDRGILVPNMCSALRDLREYL